jgi:hypothetical protein
MTASGRLKPRLGAYGHDVGARFIAPRLRGLD